MANVSAQSKLFFFLSFSPPDSFVGFVAPSPCHLQSQSSEWRTEEGVGPLTAPPASSNLHSNRPNGPLLLGHNWFSLCTLEHVNGENAFHVIRCLDGQFWSGPLLEINRTAVTVFTAGSLFNKGICQFVIYVYTSGVIVFLTFEFLIIRPTVRKKKSFTVSCGMRTHLHATSFVVT